MRGPIRILSIIGELSFGGGEERLLALSQNIDRDRFVHYVASIHAPDSNEVETCAMRRRYSASGIEVLDLGVIPEYGPRSVRRKIQGQGERVRKLREIVEELDIDLIDAHLESASLAGTVVGVLTGRKTSVTLYHAEPLAPVPLWGVAKQFILANTDIVVTDSEIRASEIQSASLLHRPEVAIIPNGVPPPLPSRSRTDVLSWLRIPSDPDVRIVGTVGGLVEFKGQGILLEAAAAVLKDAPNTFFVMVGYERHILHAPDYKSRLEQRARELGISDRIRIFSYPGPIGDIWSVIDIHVHASLFDSLPNSIIEGMSLGKPAIVTSVGGASKAVADGCTGIVIPPGSQRELATAILRLIRNPSLGREFGAAAFFRYQQWFRPELMARRLESCFVEIMEGPRSSRLQRNERWTRVRPS